MYVIVGMNEVKSEIHKAESQEGKIINILKTPWALAEDIVTNNQEIKIL